MASLWRTQRPRFTLYQSDGLGRDFYIKYTNGGFWENQFVISKKPDYIRNKYNNFHSLFHMAAPFKYWGDGSGRENYILKCNGFYHDQKPLCSYELTDFLRNGKNIKGTPDNYGFRKKLYLSVAENKLLKKNKTLENNTSSPNCNNNLKINKFKKYENTFNTCFNGYEPKKKKIRKIKFLTPKNHLELNIDENEIGYKKAVVGGKLINKRIQIV